MFNLVTTDEHAVGKCWGPGETGVGAGVYSGEKNAAIGEEGCLSGHYGDQANCSELYWVAQTLLVISSSGVSMQSTVE